MSQPHSHAVLSSRRLVAPTSTSSSLGAQTAQTRARPAPSPLSHVPAATVKRCGPRSASALSITACGPALRHLSRASPECSTRRPAPPSSTGADAAGFHPRSHRSRHRHRSARCGTRTAAVGEWMALHPLEAAVGITVVRAWLTDIFGQMVLDKQAFQDIDWRRVAAFTAFSGLYTAWFQYYLFNLLLTPLPTWFGLAGGSLAAAACTALVDQVVCIPFLCLPTYYFFLAWAEKADDLLLATADKWKADVVSTCKASIALWLPAQTINFAFLPSHLTIPFINVVGTVWMLYLGTKAGPRIASPFVFPCFDTADLNDDGVIDRAEYAAAGFKEQTGLSFDTVDENDDGVIQREEFEKAFGSGRNGLGGAAPA